MKWLLAVVYANNKLTIHVVFAYVVLNWQNA